MHSFKRSFYVIDVTHSPKAFTLTARTTGLNTISQKHKCYAHKHYDCETDEGFL